MVKFTRPFVLITGGSKGIGRELLNLFIKQGFGVITSSRSQVSVDSLNTINHVHAHQLDLEKEGSIGEFISWVERGGFKPLILINNAGTATMGSLEFVSDEERLSLIRTNLLGPISLTRQIIPLMDKPNSKIINISSDEGLVTLPYSVDYGISKHAFDAFSEGLHFELKKTNINVITINPGMVNTSLIDSIIKKIEQRNIEARNREQSDRFLMERERLVDEIESNKGGVDASEIASEVIQILNLPNTLPQYLLTSPTETEYVITTLIDKVVSLNSSSIFNFTLQELKDKLEFSYDAVENLGKN